MRDTDLAWTAGIVDGEGCIDIRKMRPTGNPKRPYGKYICALRVSNTDVRMVMRLKELFGGNVQGPRLLRLSTKPAYEWILVGGKATNAIRAICPFLVVKREQAELYLRFAATMIYNHYGGNRKLPDDVAAQRDAMIVEMTTLRGQRKVS